MNINKICILMAIAVPTSLPPYYTYEVTVTHNDIRYHQTFTWASCQIRKIAGTHAPGMPETFFLPPRVSDPDMHDGTCVTHVPSCMTGSLTSSFLWSRLRGINVPGIPGACATRNFTYLARAPCPQWYESVAVTWLKCNVADKISQALLSARHVIF